MIIFSLSDFSELASVSFSLLQLRYKYHVILVDQFTIVFKDISYAVTACNLQKMVYAKLVFLKHGVVFSIDVYF